MWLELYYAQRYIKALYLYDILRKATVSGRLVEATARRLRRDHYQETYRANQLLKPRLCATGLWTPRADHGTATNAAAIRGLRQFLLQRLQSIAAIDRRVWRRRITALRRHWLQKQLWKKRKWVSGAWEPWATKRPWPTGVRVLIAWNRDIEHRRRK